MSSWKKAREIVPKEERGFVYFRKLFIDGYFDEFELLVNKHVPIHRNIDSCLLTLENADYYNVNDMSVKWFFNYSIFKLDNKVDKNEILWTYLGTDYYKMGLKWKEIMERYNVKN